MPRSRKPGAAKRAAKPGPAPKRPAARRTRRKAEAAGAASSRAAEPKQAKARPRRAGRPWRDGVSGKLLFPRLSPRTYEHPADRAALVAMRAVPGFDAVVRGLFRTIGDRSLRAAFLGSAVRVTPRQFPGVHARHLEACRILDVNPPPDLFIAQTPVVNAGALGVDRPFVVLNSGSLGLLDADELQFVIGHELGHVLSGHALYKTVLRLLLRMSTLALSVPLGGPALLAITAAMLEWDRKSELSADRAGLLVAQSPDLALQVQMKLAGGGRTEQMSLAEFLDQAEEYHSGGNALDSVMRLLNLLGRTHPFPVLRLAELKKWVDAGEYDRILEEGYPTRDEDPKTSLYDELTRTSSHYRDELKASRDPLVRWLRELARHMQSTGAGVIDLLRGPRQRRPPG